MRPVRRMLALGAALPLASCSGPQAVHDVAGPTARSIHQLGIIMYVGAALVTLLVLVLLLIPLFQKERREVRTGLFLWGGGVILPLVTLTALVPYVLSVGRETRAPTRDTVIVDITGHQFWWEVSYRTPDGPVPTANELRLPVGEPVELQLHSEDVIHSLWVPALAGKTDLIPGRINRMVVEADRAGFFRGQCAEYCGWQHALMAIDVVAVPRAAFDAWLARLAAPAPAPDDPELRLGRDVFHAAGCGACHTVRGVSNGTLGPDLTQVGARRTIGAGALPTSVGGFAGWIASTQHIKPGSEMPSFAGLRGPQLSALAKYLDSLR